MTQEIKRSQITLNPYNPKYHSDEEVKLQVSNIKANGYLGGIVWNKQSGNLLDGHRRVQALDVINRYDGTLETDYTIKVEVVDFDKKTELEQLTYMAVGNGKADYNRIAVYASDIDITHIGLSDNELKALNDLISQTTNPVEELLQPKIEDLGNEFISSLPSFTPASPLYEIKKEEKTFDDIAEERKTQNHESKDDIIAKKKKQMEIADNRNSINTLYVMLSFSEKDDLANFCDALGYPFQTGLLIDGVEFMEKLGV